VPINVAIVFSLSFSCVFSGLLVPYRIYTYTQDLITLHELQLSLLLLGVSSGTLLLFGWAATRTICYIYTTSECDRVILTHVNFWGRRQNIDMETSDIVPINDIETPDRMILPFKRYSTDRTLYYSLRVGQCLDRARFNRIFAGVITQDTKQWW
jgi:hypothetical protein